MGTVSGGNESVTIFILGINDSLNGTAFMPEGFNPETDTLVQGANGLIWTHYYTVNEIIEKLIPVFGLLFILVVYLSYTYISPKTIYYLKSKYGRNLNEN